MSHNSGSRDYYHTSSSDRSLPPIREHLPDFFEPRSSEHSSRSSDPSRGQAAGYSSMHHSRSNTYDASEEPSHRHSQSSRSASHSYPSQQSHPMTSPQGPPGYQFGLYRSSAEQLRHERSSHRDDFLSKPARSPDNPSKRHACAACGARFDRPGSLETHMRSHTGEKPFQCTAEGCTRAFSTSSNMRRHLATHSASSAFEPAEHSHTTQRPYSSTSRSHQSSSRGN